MVINNFNLYLQKTPALNKNSKINVREQGRESYHLGLICTVC